MVLYPDVVGRLRGAATRAADTAAELRRVEAEAPGTLAHRIADDEAHGAMMALRLTPGEAITLVDEIVSLRRALGLAER